MEQRLVLILVDGLGYQTAVEQMGYLEGLVAAGEAGRVKLKAALPTMSLPLYETIHTGLVPAAHGITANASIQASAHDNLFSITRAHGGITAAAAYSWFSVLYNGRAFDGLRQSDMDDPEAAIQHGRYYVQEDYPDGELFARAGAVIHQHMPNYLLLHPNGCDHMGHAYGGASPEYQKKAVKIDNLIAVYAPVWLQAGYNILVTSDHGIDMGGNHGGTKSDVRDVPLYLLGPAAAHLQPLDESCQTCVAPTALKLMQLPIPAAMTTAPLL